MAQEGLEFGNRDQQSAAYSPETSGEMVILTGPPGSGKTTVAAMLAAGSDVPSVHLHTDDFWHMIKAGLIMPFLPQAHRQNGVVISAIARAAQAYADGGFLIIVDGIVGPWFLDPFRALGQPLHYIVLRPALETTLARATARGTGALTEPEPIRDLHRQFAALDAPSPAMSSTRRGRRKARPARR